MVIHISSAFDSGNIRVVSAEKPEDIHLEITVDAGDEHMQWFHYRVSGVRGQQLSMHIDNAKDASYPPGWENYRACASYNRQDWFRVTTSYRNGVLNIQHQPQQDSVYYAYFAPYSLERHHDLVARSAQHPRCRATVLGDTVDGRPLDMLRIGEPGEGRKTCYFIARQHPGESMAEWFMEGLLQRLLNDDDPLVRKLLQTAVIYAVPNMNPDGSTRGHLRTNAAGANLNREWNGPTMERSPEVFLVRQQMDASGLHFCLDVHGDEALPYNFIAGSDGVANLADNIRQARHSYEAAFVRANPDFQTQYGYPKAQPGQGDLRKATNQLAHRFGALAMTLEMPFKDNANAPDEHHGWSPGRCRQLGKSSLDALAAVIDQI